MNQVLGSLGVGVSMRADPIRAVHAGNGRFRLHFDRTDLDSLLLFG